MRIVVHYKKFCLLGSLTSTNGRTGKQSVNELKIHPIINKLIVVDNTGVISIYVLYLI